MGKWQRYHEARAREVINRSGRTIGSPGKAAAAEVSTYLARIESGYGNSPDSGPKRSGTPGEGDFLGGLGDLQGVSGRTIGIIGAVILAIGLLVLLFLAYQRLQRWRSLKRYNEASHLDQEDTGTQQRRYKTWSTR